METWELGLILLIFGILFTAIGILVYKIEKFDGDPVEMPRICGMDLPTYTLLYM